MPFVFIFLAIGLIVVGLKGTQSQAFALLKSEFTGSNSFVVWVAAIAILGALAYIKPIRPVAVALMVLVLLVMVLNNKGGFFSQFNSQLANPIAPQNAGAAGNGSGISLPQLFTAPPGNSGSLAPGAAGPYNPNASPFETLGIPLGYST